MQHIKVGKAKHIGSQPGSVLSSTIPRTAEKTKCLRKGCSRDEANPNLMLGKQQSHLCPVC